MKSRRTRFLLVLFVALAAIIAGALAALLKDQESARSVEVLQVAYQGNREHRSRLQYGGTRGGDWLIFVYHRYPNGMASQHRVHLVGGLDATNQLLVWNGGSASWRDNI